MSVEQVTAEEAFLKLSSQKNTVLIDVRTDAEFSFVGIADLHQIEADLILLPWNTFPTMAPNPDFGTKLEKTLLEKFGENRHEAQLIFICRSGARSQQAATYMIQLGYDNCFNLTSGFEGDLDSSSHRGNLSGWKASNLPWRQA